MMCFAEVGRVGSVNGSTARVLTERGASDASLAVMAAQGAAIDVGDWVVVSLGLVLERLDEESGRTMFDEHRLVHEATVGDGG